MDSSKHLGISIVGQSTNDGNGDGGIYVGEITRELVIFHHEYFDFFVSRSKNAQLSSRYGPGSAGAKRKNFFCELRTTFETYPHHMNARNTLKLSYFRGQAFKVRTSKVGASFRAQNEQSFRFAQGFKIKNLQI